MKLRIISLATIAAAFVAYSNLALGAPAISYNTFLEDPQRLGQLPGFGYHGGGQSTSNIIGNSFIPNITGSISTIWIGIGSDLSDVGSDLVELSIAESGSQNQPTSELARFTIMGELSKRESVVALHATTQNIEIFAGVRYWVLIAPGDGTEAVNWLGGPSDYIPGQLFTVPSTTEPSGWFTSESNANGALRIDVQPVPILPPIWLLLSCVFLLRSQLTKLRPG